MAVLEQNGNRITVIIDETESKEYVFSKIKNLEDKNLELETQLSQAQSDNLTTLEACAELYELLLASQPV